MSGTSVQQLKEIGQSMGLKGPKLINFVREQQTIERKEREKQREKNLDRKKEDERLKKLRLFEVKQKAK